MDNRIPIDRGRRSCGKVTVSRRHTTGVRARGKHVGDTATGDTRERSNGPPMATQRTIDEALLQQIAAPFVAGEAEALRLSRSLLRHFRDFSSIIAADVAELRLITTAADALASQFDLIRRALQRVALGDVDSRPLFPIPASVAHYCRASIGFGHQEELRILFLNGNHRMINEETLAVGTACSVPCEPRLIVRRALELNASAMILAHNHPSGDPRPSPDDIRVTRKLRDAARSMNIALLDHLIVAPSSWVSLRAEGLI